ncbi:peroxiredoxin family protein [Microvirga tunisiensis]|uniref:peroxiredoxin family protein n=1 Tax=Microvirga tunisiensis TaxID=2108360 RepID=UPI001FCE80E7|nr:TlpA disulfide reductase family protein [Microvirga tunisiensis]
MPPSVDSTVPQAHADGVLRVNCLAPPIKVESWVRGPPLTSFRPGTRYVIVFWAISSIYCVEAMPHLVQLQEKYKDSGLEVVGVAASERAPTVDEDRTTLHARLADKLPNLNFRIALDYTGEMNKLWMDASASFWIPSSFIVSPDGRIGPAMKAED